VPEASGSLGARWAIARRELAALRSEKTIVLALAIQLFVAAFSSFLVVGLVSLYDPSGLQGFTVDAGVTGPASDDVAAALDDGMDVERYEDAASAQRAFEDREIDVVLVTNETVNGTIDVRAVVPEENVRTTVAVVGIREGMESLEHRLRVERAADGATLPLSVPERTSASPYFGFSYTVLVPLLCFLPVFVSGSIAVDSLTEESQRGTLELLRVAPVSVVDIVDAKLLATATLAPLQAVAWLVLLGVNGTVVRNLGLLVVLVAGLAFAVVSFGVAVALWTSDRRQAQFLYSAGIIAAATFGGFLPEHPANTVARLAIGTTTPTTVALAVGYAVTGAVAYLALRGAVGRLDPERL